jgi:hypothetical protein
VGWLIRFFQLRDAEGVFVVTSKSMGAFCVSTLAGMNAVLSQSPWNRSPHRDNRQIDYWELIHNLYHFMNTYGSLSKLGSYSIKNTRNETQVHWISVLIILYHSLFLSCLHGVPSDRTTNTINTVMLSLSLSYDIWLCVYVPLSYRFHVCGKTYDLCASEPGSLDLTFRSLVPSIYL